MIDFHDIYTQWYINYKFHIEIISMLSVITPLQMVYHVISGKDTRCFIDISAILIIIVLITIGLNMLYSQAYLMFIGNTFSLLQWFIIFTFHTFINRKYNVS